MTLRKDATTSVPIHPLMQERWSPRAFDPQSLSLGDLMACFEAARWAASSMNEQPWRFILAQRDHEEEFEKALECLVPANRQWALRAGAIIFVLVKETFSANGNPNAHARYDAGQAVAQFTLEAWNRGLVVHQMGGFTPDEVRTHFPVAEGHEPLVAIAIGKQGEPEVLNEPRKSWESSPRERRSLSDTVLVAGETD